MNTQNRLNKIAKSIRDDVPQKPGVYLFFDRFGNRMYIGKSKKLKQRMLSYFRSNQTGLEVRIQQMIFNIHDYSFCRTDTELLALLLEDNLIKNHNPSYNIRQREYLQYRHLLMTDDRFPTLKMIDCDEIYNGKKIFGPFRDEYFVDDILTLIHHNLGLRSCEGSLPKKVCFQYEMGWCGGPCIGEITQGDYAKIVSQTTDFLNGNESSIVDSLTQRLEKKAANRKFEEAQKIKEQLIFCKKFCERQRFIQQFKTRKAILHTKNGKRATYVFSNGCLSTAESSGIDNDFIKKYQPRIDHSEDNRFLMDRANIVFNWVTNNKQDWDVHFEEIETQATLF